MADSSRVALPRPESAPARKPPGNRVRRTPEVQRDRDRKIPRPADGSGLSCAGPNEWLHIWHEVAAKPPVKVVGYALLKFADYWDGADIFPGEEALAAMTQQTTRTVRKALAEMREWGLIWRYVEGSAHGRQGVADAYRLTVPDDLATCVPLIVEVAALADHRNEIPVIGPEQENEVPVVTPEQGNDVPVIGEEHRNLTTGTPEPERTEHRNDVPATVTSNRIPVTPSSPGVPVANGSVEGAHPEHDHPKPVRLIPPQDDGQNSPNGQCGYAQCRIRTPVPPGRDMHEGCERFARLKAQQAARLLPLPPPAPGPSRCQPEAP